MLTKNEQTKPIIERTLLDYWVTQGVLKTDHHTGEGMRSQAYSYMAGGKLSQYHQLQRAESLFPIHCGIPSAQNHAWHLGTQGIFVEHNGRPIGNIHQES